MPDNEKFHKHYTGLFKAKLQQYELSQEGNSESRAPLTFFEVRRQLRALKTVKAPGQSSIITTDSDISKAVASNCKKARLAIVKLRAALVSGTLRLKTKCRLIEIFLKPILLYGPETSITRKTDREKMSTVLNKAQRRGKKINDKRVMPEKELSKAVPLKDIETELAVRRANLWVSLNNLKVPELLSICKSRKTYTKDWLRTLKNDLKRLKVFNIEEWIKKRKSMKYSEKVDTTIKSVGERPQIIECSMKSCIRMFATTKEMNRHVRTDHDVTTMESELDPEVIVIPTTIPLCCPLSGCNKSYKRVGWWKAHMRNAHPQCVVVESDMKVASTQESAAQASSDLTVGTSSQVFQCPKCARQYNVMKSLVNHYYEKHGWSYSKGREVGRRGTRGSQPEYSPLPRDPDNPGAPSHGSQRI